MTPLRAVERFHIHRGLLAPLPVPFAAFDSGLTMTLRCWRFPRVVVAMLLAAIALVATGTPCAADEPAPSPALSEEQVTALIRSRLVASPYRISDHALAGRIRYEIAVPIGTVLTLPETGEQHVEQRGDRLLVTICKDACGREAAPDPAELQRYLQPNPWVQSDDRTIARFAHVGSWRSTVDQRMRLLVAAVSARMSGPIEFRHYWTAREAFDKQGGDCTEFAVLLAAAARARGIPTRVVAGLGYSSQFLGAQHVFVPHMWVQAWDGKRWASYDAALGDFDAGHVALVLGDGTPASLSAWAETIRNMRIVGAVGLVPPAADSAR